jgi:hypothetical protein
MTNPGISSSPIDLEGFCLLMTLQTSASEIVARDKIQKIAKEGVYRQGNGYYKQTENA